MKTMLACLSVLALTLSAFAAEPIIWNKENQFKGWGGAFRCKTALTEEGMSITVLNVDCNICNNSVKLEPKEYSQLQIEYRAKDIPERNNGKLYYATAAKGFNEGSIWQFSGLKNDWEWHTLTVTNNSQKWTEAGTVIKIRLDIIEQTPGTIEIRSITFSNPQVK